MATFVSSAYADFATDRRGVYMDFLYLNLGPKEIDQTGFGWSAIPHTSSTFGFLYDDGGIGDPTSVIRVVYDGTSFTYTDVDSTVPVSGAISSIHYVFNGSSTGFRYGFNWSISGLSIPASELQGATPKQLVDLMLSGDDSIHGTNFNDKLFGGTGNDLVSGGLGNDTVDGGPGNDGVYGGAGNDVLIGGIGNDILGGGAGKDLMTGGAGQDRMVLRKLSDSGTTFATRDVIRGFAHGDKIDLSAIDANTNVVGNQSFKWAKVFTGAAGQLVVTKTTDTATVDRYLVRGDVNGDKVADFSVQIYGSPALDKVYAWDFVV